MDKFSEELNEMLVSTYRSIHLIEESMLSDLSDDKLSIGEMHIIDYIGSGEADGRTITDIAQAQAITLPSITVAVKKLEKKGFVYKQRCEHDGRRIYVRLTEFGRRAYISHRYFHREMVRGVVRTLPEDERSALLHGLEGLNEFFRDKAENIKCRAIQQAGKPELPPTTAHGKADGGDAD